VVPAEVREAFLPVTRAPSADGRLLYRPALLGKAMLHYANARAKVDEWESVAVLSLLGERATDPWDEPLLCTRAAPELDEQPEPAAGFADLPAAGAQAKRYPRFAKMLESWLYREKPLLLFRCGDPKQTSRPGESEGAFRGRLRELLREQRDLEVEKLRQRYAPKLARLAEQIERARRRVEVEREQYQEKKFQSAISIGATVLGAVFGRKLASATTVGRATTAARGVGRAARERGDISRAEEKMESLQEKLDALEAEFQDDLAALEAGRSADDLALDELRIAPRKSDLDAEPVRLVWTPWQVSPDGIAEPLFDV
jgi:hypothetical protein